MTNLIPRALLNTIIHHKGMPKANLENPLPYITVSGAATRTHRYMQVTVKPTLHYLVVLAQAIT